MLTILALVTMVCLNEVSEASFRDEFNVSGLVAYTGSNSYGSGGSYTVSGGKLRITTGADNTYSVMTSNTVEFNIGDILSLDVPAVSGTESVFMMCSTSAAQPDGTSTFGFRFRRDGVMYARMNLYPGGIQANTLDPNPDLPATLMVKRTSDTYFEYSIKIEGVQTELGSFTLTNLSGNYNLFIGAQAYKQTSGTTFAFDNLQVYNPNFTDITVLTYNTHLFKGVSVDAFMEKYIYEDEIRRGYIIDKIKASNADIVALQEVWADPWVTDYFIPGLDANYPYTAYMYKGCDSYAWGFDTLSHGVLLLSKWPISNKRFARFPTFFPSCSIGDAGDNWANKGVWTATVDVMGMPIRVGVSHALTGPSDHKSSWSTADCLATAITTFQLKGEPYIFALKQDGQADIRRFEDYSYFDEESQTEKHGAGWKHVCTGVWGSDCVTVTSFELDGHPYLFILNKNSQGHIIRINDDGMGWTTMNYGAWSSDHIAVISFQLNGHPYLFGVNTKNEGHIERINDDGMGWTTMKYGAWGHEYEALTPFELDGHPYIFGLTEFNQGHITRINDDPSTGWSFVSPWNTWDSEAWPHSGPDYIAVKSFQMNGHPYLFALKNCCDKITCCGLCPFGGCDSCLIPTDPWLNFASYPSRCDPCMRGFPREVYLKRIKDDPNTGWENLYQLEDIKIIRDATVVEDGPPAIMMGDFNIHRSKYGIMDQLFRKAGAVDAYIEVHGSGKGGETIDLGKNRPAQIFCEDKPDTSYNDCDTSDPNVYPTEMTLDRIDYVYVKQSGAGLRLVPTDAYVIRDWQYYSAGAAGYMDLSDHYPVVTKFRIFQGGCTARMKGDLNCDRVIGPGDLAILCSAWLSQPGDAMWDSACDMSDPMDDRIDLKDFERLARYWGAMAVHNVTQDTWYGFIQVAINDANDGDEIEVGPGTYLEAINFEGKAIYLHSTDGPEVTTINASRLNASVVTCSRGEDANSILDGFTLTGGRGTKVLGDTYGGGMYNLNSSPTVNHCIFTANLVTSGGGGMWNENSNPTMTDCAFSGNTAWGAGCGMYNTSSNPTMTNCTFSNNLYGGGMYNTTSNPILTDCNFTANSANEGGGMYNTSSNPTMTNCTFSNNVGTYGGGMYNTSSNPAMTDCTFTANRANDGAGMFNTGTSKPILTDCTFSGNTADVHGGGMYNTTSNPILTDCNFTGNEAGTNGGGICNITDSSPTLTLCLFSGNLALSTGGGMINSANSSPVMTDCTFTDNVAYGDGGGMINNSSSSPKLTDCTFTGNSADGFANGNGDGGGIHNASSNPKLTNCIFSQNTAQSYGGGMYNTAGRATLTNCIFYENTARTASGGGYANYNGSNSTLINCTVYQNWAGHGLRNWDSTLVVTNCILWYNYPSEISSEGSSSLTVSYSNIYGTWSGTGNIDEYPFFVDPDGGDLRLSSGSPCIDKGSNAAVSGITTDLDGNPRVLDGDSNGTVIVDMGAYEYLVTTGNSLERSLEAYYLLASRWLEDPWPRPTDVAVPEMRHIGFDY